MSDAGPTVYNGRYELHRRLGRGGMAEVFLARDQLLDRPVAVKVLFPEFATDPSFVERFRREAQAAANLNHPNIVGVYDWGQASGTYFIVMEYVDGRTLADILRAEGPLHPDRAADIATDVAAALGSAHRNGVVHRDVKPGNVIVSTNGQVKVTDFGIARAVTATSDDNLTQAGTVMGTATYFSPEQARGDAVDPRSDLYSLGCVMYESVVGRPPFSGDSPVAIAYKHVQESPTPPRQLNPAVPTAMEAIILKCLAKNPVNRYPSAEDLRADLRRFREGHRILAEPVMAPPTDPGATGIMAATQAQPAYTQVGAPVAEYEEEPEPRRSSGAFIALMVVLLLILAGLLFLLARSLGLGEGDEVRQVPVPNVVGDPVDEARATLVELGFDVVTEFEESQDAEEDTVIEQDPVAGTEVDEGAEVTLTVSTGAPLVEVPDVVGEDLDTARQVLRDAGFDVRVEPQADDDAPENEVLAQDPAGSGEAPQGSTVVLTVSSGPEERPVPDVRGMTVAEASNRLGQDGFSVTQTTEESTEVPEGQVIRTEPEIGSVQPPGTTITLVVSSGPPQAEIPNVVGDREGQARAALQQAGFGDITVQRQEVQSPAEDGVVLDQDPGPGPAEPGTPITLVVGRFEISPPGGGDGGGNGNGGADPGTGGN